VLLLLIVKLQNFLNVPRTFCRLRPSASSALPCFVPFPFICFSAHLATPLPFTVALWIVIAYPYGSVIVNHCRIGKCFKNGKVHAQRDNVDNANNASPPQNLNRGFALQFRSVTSCVAMHKPQLVRFHRNAHTL